MQAHTILTISTALLIASISTAHGDLLNVELRKAYAECKTSQEACESICKQAIPSSYCFVIPRKRFEQVG